jgi:putative FmdB family regulatory protein
MPTYEYACRACGEHLEVVQSFRDDPLSECPACQGQLRKVFSAAGIIFKGSGWHVKDYASSSRAASGSSGSSEASSRSGGDADGRSTSGSASAESSKAGDSSGRPASTSSVKAGKAPKSEASTSSSERAASA